MCVCVRVRVRVRVHVCVRVRVRVRVRVPVPVPTAYSDSILFFLEALVSELGTGVIPIISQYNRTHLVRIDLKFCNSSNFPK